MPSTSSSSSSPSPRPKSRPTASCLPCRTRKVKCNRLTPCESCLARSIPHECKYAAPDADRQAIAQAEQIAELRAKVRRLRGQLVQGGSSRHGDGESNSHGEEGSDGEADEEPRLAQMEAVYEALKGGSWEDAQGVVARLRAGEGMGSLSVSV